MLVHGVTEILAKTVVGNGTNTGSAVFRAVEVPTVGTWRENICHRPVAFRLEVTGELADSKYSDGVVSGKDKLSWRENHETGSEKEKGSPPTPTWTITLFISMVLDPILRCHVYV